MMYSILPSGDYLGILAENTVQKEATVLIRYPPFFIDVV